MTSEEEIEHLMTVPPRPALTRGDKIERFIGWVTAVTALAGLVIAIIVGLSGAATAAEAKKAGVAAQHAVDCINRVLGARGPATAADNAAQTALVEAISQDAKSFGILLGDILIKAPAGKSTPDFLNYIKVHTALINTANRTSATLQMDQAFRASHPLGTC